MVAEVCWNVTAIAALTRVILSIQRRSRTITSHTAGKEVFFRCKPIDRSLKTHDSCFRLYCDM